MPTREQADPYGFAFGPQGPPRTPQQHPGDYSFVKSLLSLYSDLWHSQYDPVRAEKTFGGRPRKSSGSLVDQLLPITDQGMQNWSAIFQPGGKGTGGKMTNLTQADREFLASLQNVRSGPPEGMLPFSTFKQRGDEWIETTPRMRGYQEPSPGPRTIDGPTLDSIHPIMKQLGSTIYGVKPLDQLKGQSLLHARQSLPEVNPTSELGIEPSRGFPKQYTERFWKTEAQRPNGATLNPSILADKLSAMIPNMSPHIDRMTRNVLDSVRKGDYSAALVEISSKVNLRSGGPQSEIFKRAYELINEQADRQANLLMLWDKLGRPNARGHTPEAN